MSTYNLLATEFIIWVHLFLVFLLKVDKSFKFLWAQCLFYNTCIQLLSAFILRAFYDKIVGVQVFFYIAPHALAAKKMPTSLIKIID